MDLSVLKGDDPAGYKVEAKIKANKDSMEKGRRKGKKAQNPGSAFLKDGLPAGRRSRFVDIKKPSGKRKGRIQRELDEKYEQHKEQTQGELDKKTAKRREKRQRRKQRGRAMIIDTGSTEKGE